MDRFFVVLYFQTSYVRPEGHQARDMSMCVSSLEATQGKCQSSRLLMTNSLRSGLLKLACA